jgi:branched-chain amino acid aminotransferase
MAFLFYFEPVNNICFNGKIMTADEPVLMADNRGYRYGDGLFETMKIENGLLQLFSFHMDRLWSGMQLLKLEIPKLFTPERVHAEIMQLCKKNQCYDLGRVRLSVFRGNGGLYDGDKTLQYLIEAWPLSESANRLNENGLVIGIFPDASKSCDQFSQLKSANYLPYTMAAHYAKEQHWNDCLVLNQFGNISDSTIANIFILKGGEWITPELTEGCVNGVMRRYLLQQLPAAGYIVREAIITTADVDKADEMFLSNAIYGLKWVRRFQNKQFGNTETTKIYRDFVQTINE